MEMSKKLVYFQELSNEAKEKARTWFRENNDYMFLEESLQEFVTERIKERGYSIDVPVEVLYSLTCSQGDGVSFTAVLLKNGKRYEVKQSGRYYHEYTMNVYHETDGEETEEEAILSEMRAIAVEAKKYGYSFIESEDSNEHVDDTIMANEYTFTLEGLRMSPDKN